jgi:hypothetical protein
MKILPVSVRAQDWNPTVGGWSIPALGIPGAKPTKLFAQGEELDARTYRAEGDMLLWSGAKPAPQELLLCLTLEEELSTKRSTVLWQRIAIAMPLITLVVGWGLAQLAAPKPKENHVQKGSFYETWTVKGIIQADRGILASITSDVTPPKVTIGKDGSFDEKIPVLNDGGQLKFPSISFKPADATLDDIVLHPHQPFGVFTEKIDGSTITYPKPLVFARAP